MRVALVVEAASGGTGRHVTDLACELLSLGHVVDVLYSTARIDERFKRCIANLSASPDFRSCATEWCHDLRGRDLKAIASLANYLRIHGQFDIVHAHSTKAGLLARVAGAICRVPVIYTPHGVLSWDPTVGRLKRKLAAIMELGLSFLTSRVVAVSARERDHLAELGIRMHRLTLIRNGVDSDYYNNLKTRRPEARARFGLRESEVCVGFVGRFVPQKDPQLLLRAFALAADSNHCLRLLLVGDGPLRRELEGLARSVGIWNRIIWLGSLDAAEALPAFDLFALSSCTESLPYVVLEALATGLPVVATDVGGVSEVVETGRTGFLVPAGDVAGFARALVELAGYATRRADMAVTAPNTSTLFGVQAMARQIEQLYRDAANKRRMLVARCFEKENIRSRDAEPGVIGGE